MADSKRFKCTAINEYSAKPRRFYTPSLHVRASVAAFEVQQPKLLPPLQNRTVTIGSGQTLRLLCTTRMNAKASAIEWRFTARSTSSATASTILLEPSNRIELKIANVTPEANDGIYNCSYAGEFQVSFRIHIRLSFPIYTMMWLDAHAPAHSAPRLNQHF